MEKPEIYRDQGVTVHPAPPSVATVEADDRIDTFVGGKVGELPLLGDVVGRNSTRSDNENQPVALVNGIADFLVKCECTRRHRNTIEPDIEQRAIRPTCSLQSIVEPSDERLIVSTGIGEKHLRHSLMLNVGLAGRTLQIIRSGPATAFPAPLRWYITPAYTGARTAP